MARASRAEYRAADQQPHPPNRMNNPWTLDLGT